MKEHKLAAIVFTDIVGYTKRMESDEEGTMKLLARQREILFPIVKEYGGEVIKEIGDGLMMMFTSANRAVRFAMAIQEKLKDDELTIRAGIHIGDVIFEEGDPADNFYILQSGALHLYMAGTRQATCVALKAGEAFGWSSLVGRKTYSAGVECTEPGTLYKINKDKLDHVLRQNPITGLLFYKRLAGLVGGHVIKCYQEMARLQEDRV